MSPKYFAQTTPVSSSVVLGPPSAKLNGSKVQGSRKSPKTTLGILVKIAAWLVIIILVYRAKPKTFPDILLPNFSPCLSCSGRTERRPQPGGHQSWGILPPPTRCIAFSKTSCCRWLLVWPHWTPPLWQLAWTWLRWPLQDNPPAIHRQPAAVALPAIRSNRCIGYLRFLTEF